MSPTARKRGPLMAIGGAEDKIHNREILRRFVSEAGSSKARIIIFPTASMLADTGTQYESLFHLMGAAETHVVLVRDREEALSHETEIAALIDGATGVFFSGGNQMRISTILGGTNISRALRRANANGAVIAGTSAGAALLSEHMIAFGQSGPSLSHGMVTIAPGLGLTSRVIIDQHFRQRDRLGRLLSALTYNPYLIGLGVDEDTAAIIDAQEIVHVIGSGSVTVVDVSKSTWTNADQMVDAHAPLALLNANINILTPVCTYDLDKRRASPPPAYLLQGER